MRTRNIFLSLASAALLAACSSAGSGDEYTINIPLGNSSANDQVAYLVNFDTDEKVDSTVVAADTVRFTGKVETPYLARIIIGGQRAGMVIVEKGVTSLDSAGRFTGSPLNTRFQTLTLQVDSLMKAARAIPEDSIGALKLEELNKQYDTLLANTVKQNADNPVGYYAFLQQMYEWDINQLDAKLKEYPSMADYTRVKNYRAALDRKAKTSVGQTYTDFEVPSDSVAVKLSQFVGKDGKLTLVDFWASWCGPCRREIPVIKGLLEKYKDDLNVVGVAVWDEPANTELAIKELDIKWPVIINAQKIPTDIYGISGIPCIIVIGPDGKILSRDRQGDALVAEVDSLIALRKAPRDLPAPKDSVK